MMSLLNPCRHRPSPCDHTARFRQAASFPPRQGIMCSSRLVRSFPPTTATVEAPRIRFSIAATSRASERATGRRRPVVVVRACLGEQKGKGRSFLSMEEAGLVEMSGLSTHERFLCRLTVSSLNLLRVIAEQEGVPIEELNAGRLCDWFLKDKLKREQNIDSAVLQWDDSDLQI